MILINAAKIRNIILLLLFTYPSIICATEEDNKLNVNLNKEAWIKNSNLQKNISEA